MSALQSIFSLVITTGNDKYITLREKLYALKLQKQSTSDCTMQAFYTHCIHDVEREIFALQETEGR